jgi:hypothetical protein
LSQFLERVRQLISSGHIRISEHGYDESAKDGLDCKRYGRGCSRRSGCGGIPETDYAFDPAKVMVVVLRHAFRSRLKS